VGTSEHGDEPLVSGTMELVVSCPQLNIDLHQ
jgi:hypothetical protein